MRYRIENLTRSSGVAPDNAFLKSTRREVRREPVPALMVADSYSVCSHALKAHRYTPVQGNVFDFILDACNKVRKDYGV